jgi:hypothetical protein
MLFVTGLNNPENFNLLKPSGFLRTSTTRFNIQKFYLALALR